MKHLHKSVVLLIAAFSLCAVAVIAPTSAAVADAPAAATASIRAAHFSPQTPGVDVYLSTYSGSMTKLWQSGISYGTVSPYVAVAPGLYIVAMRPAGAAATTPAMLSWTLQATSGQAYTAAAVPASSATTSNVKGIVFTDDLTPPPAGQGRVRLIQVASNATTADLIAVNGPSLAANAAFGTSTGYALVPAGTWPLEARSSGAPPLTVNASVSVPAGSVTTVVLLNGPGNTLKLQSVLDASAPVVAPSGPVDAGGGGMALNKSDLGTSFGSTASSDGETLKIVVVALVVLLVSGFAMSGYAGHLRRRRSATLTRA